jgi:hypothetical protein
LSTTVDDTVKLVIVRSGSGFKTPLSGLDDEPPEPELPPPPEMPPPPELAPVLPDELPPEDKIPALEPPP